MMSFLFTVSNGLPRMLGVSRLFQRSCSSRPVTDSTFNQEEVTKFRKLAARWWDPNGDCKPLHSMNALRVPLVRDGLISTGIVPKSQKQDLECLKGVSILDVGCGGGLLSEPLARIGANVIGLDAASENVAAAAEHAALDSSLADRLRFEATTVEDFAKQNPERKFHAVVASEVIEHVDNPKLFVETCASLLHPGGSLFFTTLNRTQRAWLGGIVAAEYILRFLPTGTHDWNKFITPEELESMVKGASCHPRLVHGMFYFPIIDKWTWISDTAVNYAMHAVKTHEEDVNEKSQKQE